mgnify:CR=1 FL=1
MFQDLINEALETGRPYIKEGEVATYIPELGRADKNKLGISIFCRKPVLLRGHEGSVQHPEYFEGYQPCGSP